MENSFSEEQYNKINAILTERKAVLPCPRCGNTYFSLLHGFVSLPVQNPTAENAVNGGPAIPCVVTVCNNCGFLSNHALGVLGLLANQEVEKSNGEP